MRHINRGPFLGFEIPLPPLPEQRRIVAEIETQLSRLDAAVAALGRARANLRRYRAAVLAAASTGRIPSSLHDQLLTTGGYSGPAHQHVLPHNWYWSTIEELASAEPRSIQSGPFGSALLHSEFTDKGILAIGINNVRDGKFSLGRNNRISPEKFEELRRFEARPGDVLITVMATVGRTCVVPRNVEKSIITKHVYRISVDQTKVLPEYLMLCLWGGPSVRNQLFGEVKGQTRPGINGEILRRVKVPLPLLDQQRDIVTEVERRLSVVEAAEATVAANLGRAEKLRQAVLRKAFAGGLVAQDPSDEPAAALLARIVAERAARGGGSGQRARRAGWQQALPLG